MGVTVRAMTKNDLGPVGVLAGALVKLHHAWDERRFFLPPNVEEGYRWWFSQQLAEPTAHLIVAEVDGQIAGYVYASLEERDWNLLLEEHGAIHDILVDPAFRRRGVARALMTAMLERLDKAGAKRVVLSSASQNAEAHALFEQMGFRETMVEMTRG